MAAPTLTPRQARFVAEYLRDLNATQAAIRSGYSPKTAEQQGSRLLSNAKVSAEIAERRQRRAERVEVQSDDILRELLRIARTDLSEAFNENGTLKAVHEMPEDCRRAIAGIEVEEPRYNREGEEIRGVVRKVKFWDKPRALELLGKHLGLLTEKHEHSGSVSFQVVTGVAAPPNSGARS